MVRPESFEIKGSQTLAVFKCYCGFPGHCTKLIFHFTESKELQVEMELNGIF